LFLPVSGEFGMGEYARSLAIAQGAAAHWPQAAIHFALSRRARYAAGTPFPTTMLDSSPTFHTAAVGELIRAFRPDAVIFDNAGRTAQLRAARESGARVIYISARARQRRKAFRCRWMRLIDEHWIAYPRFIAGNLSTFERLKLKLLRRPRVRFLDVILARPAAAQASAPAPTPAPTAVPDAAAPAAAAAAAAREGYVLFIPGGGTAHPGARDAVERFLAAARGLARRGVATRFVGASAPLAAAAVPSPSEPAALSLLGILPQPELAGLMQNARLVVANGGSTLLQAIACGVPCVAVPIAGDQAGRIRQCVHAGVALAAPLDAAAIERSAAQLFADDARLLAMAGRARGLELADGVEVAVQAITALLAPA
jgi:ADP-heptose:LPS heptosyltransferase